MSVRWTTSFTPTSSGNVTFSIMGDDRCRLLIDGEKRIEADVKGGYYSFNAEQARLTK
jgi:beta-glucosidase